GSGDGEAAGGQVARLRAANAGLRRVVADKDELIAVLERLLAAQRERSDTQDALISGQAEQLSKQDEMIRLQGEQIATQAELIKKLLDEVAELRRRLGMNSSNSSTPPSKDPIPAKAERRAAGGGRSVPRGSGRRIAGRVASPGTRVVGCRRRATRT